MVDRRRTAFTVLMAFLLQASAAVAQSQSPSRSSTKHATEKPEAFAAVMQKLRDTWVQEFNAGHADKVAAFYAPEAALMRWDGSVHGYDSIVTEMQRSITGGAHSYSSTACTRNAQAISAMPPAPTTSLSATAWWKAITCSW